MSQRHSKRQNNTQWQPQANSQEQPPSYSEAVNDPSQTGYYPKGYSQYPAAYPPQQGYAATAGYDTSKAAYPTQAFQQVDGYPNNYPQQYYPQPAVSNNNQTVIVTQNTQNMMVEPVSNYLCSAVFAILMFLPTGIVAVLKANEAQNQYRMGNINKAHESNREAKKFIRISLIIDLKPQVNSQVPPPGYSSVTGYNNYAQGSFQSAAAYPPPQGYAATGAYQPQSYSQGGCYTNYNQPYAGVTQNTQNVFIEPMKDYTCLAIVALLLCLPTGIAAIIKSNDAQHEYRMGNIAKARASNSSAKKFINLSLGLGLGIIVLAIIIPLVIFVAVANSENRYMY